MMRYLLALALAAATLLPAAAQADDSPDALAPPIAQCINDNAAKVEATVEDLSKAVEFLVSDVCAVSVAREEARQTKLMTDRMAQQYRKACDEKAAKGNQAKDEADGCNALNLGFGGDGDAASSFYTIYGVGGRNKPAAAIALASRLLLDLRLSHMPAKSKK